MAHGENDACMTCDRPTCDGCPYFWEEPDSYDSFDLFLDQEFQHDLPDIED